MADRRRTEPNDERSHRPPATTPEARENQLISLAVDLAEQQILEGTASAQVITHYLKLGSSREKLEQHRIVLENELVQAKTEAIASHKKMEELYEEAIIAMRSYSGQPTMERRDEHEG